MTYLKLKSCQYASSIVVPLAFMMVVFLPKLSPAQSDSKNLESRIKSLENYVETFQPSLLEFSDKLQESIHEYSRGLESSLADYSQRLQIQLEERLKVLENDAVVLDVSSRSFQRIDTNTGSFLVAVAKRENIENGIRLYINIGNPNFADYKDFSLKIFWGQPWDKNSLESYDAWRQSLTGAEYSFQGKLEMGKWNPVEIDLTPATSADLGYVECSMEVASVEMGIK